MNDSIDQFRQAINNAGMTASYSPKLTLHDAHHSARPCKETQSGHFHFTIYLRNTQGLWSKPARFGPRAVGWLVNGIEALNAAQICGMSDAEIRKLIQSAPYAVAIPLGMALKGCI